MPPNDSRYTFFSHSHVHSPEQTVCWDIKQASMDFGGMTTYKVCSLTTKELKIEINDRKKSGKLTNLWTLNKTLK